MKTKHIVTASVLLVLLLLGKPVFAKDEGKVDIYEGWLSAYDQEPTDHTLEYRLEIGDVQEGYDVYLAVPGCDRIGETGLIRFPTGETKTYQVFDCASRNTTEDQSKTWMEENNIVAEIDYYSWEEYGLGYAILLVTD